MARSAPTRCGNPDPQRIPPSREAARSSRCIDRWGRREHERKLHTQHRASPSRSAAQQKRHTSSALSRTTSKTRTTRTTPWRAPARSRPLPRPPPRPSPTPPPRPPPTPSRRPSRLSRRPSATWAWTSGSPRPCRPAASSRRSRSRPRPSPSRSPAPTSSARRRPAPARRWRSASRSCSGWCARSPPPRRPSRTPPSARSMRASPRRSRPPPPPRTPPRLPPRPAVGPGRPPPPRPRSQALRPCAGRRPRPPARPGRRADPRAGRPGHRGPVRRRQGHGRARAGPSTAAAPTSRRSPRCRAGVDVVVGTPGRLLDLAQQGHLDLGEVRALVLDEADEMLDLGFLPDVERIIAQAPGRRGRPCCSRRPCRARSSRSPAAT